ncbi:MAG: coproporphyrinogen dehydrogenase HemZ [Clostridiales bacterium]|nr:coproporphyrinogen dehydrogenase HemZ [Clostridiales bacterium]
MINTNCQFLLADIMDVVRAFGCEEESLTHYFSFNRGKFFNAVEYMGEFFDFENEQEVENDIEYKRYARRFAKLSIYSVLSKFKGSLPWGALTGIRPTKLAYAEEEAGRDFKAIFKQMGVSDQNINLTQSVLSAQKRIYNKNGGTDLFISVPFCPTKCEYCSFITAPVSATKKFIPEYLNCIESEVASIDKKIEKLNSVYIGGGTPFVLEPNELERIYTAINAVFKGNCEYTVEAGRPDVFTEEKLKLSHEYGVTRICVNPQTFNDKTLIAIGRKHTEEDVYRAYDMAKKYPFIINCDLIAGLYDETPKDFERSVLKAVEMGFDNITVHTLCLKAGAKLKENTKRLSSNGIEEMLAISRQILTEAGYVPYYMYRQKYQAGGGENVGWTKPGKACVYNVNVMEEITDNIALGANAVSKRVFLDENRIERFGTPKDIKTYIEKVDKIIIDRTEFYK